jgi:hypothetical protein
MSNSSKEKKLVTDVWTLRSFPHYGNPCVIKPQAYAFGLITKHHSHQPDKNAYHSSYLQITNNIYLFVYLCVIIHIMHTFLYERIVFVLISFFNSEENFNVLITFWSFRDKLFTTVSFNRVHNRSLIPFYCTIVPLIVIFLYEQILNLNLNFLFKVQWTMCGLSGPLPPNVNTAQNAAAMKWIKLKVSSQTVIKQ